MSGHSKWANIHKQKEVADAKKGAVFTKIARNITLAAREKGGDPEMNPSLRTAIDKAKEVNMPKDNIERAIKKGTGEIEGAKLEEIIYEGYGPGGIAIIIKCLTDNRNRSASNIRHIFTKFGGNLGEPKSVSWMFEQKGVINFWKFQLQEKDIKMDDFELKMIDAGIEDVRDEEDRILIYTNIKDLHKMKEILEDMQIKIDYSEIDWVAKNEIEIKDAETNNKVNKFLETLDSDEDVQVFYTNLE